MRQYLLKVQKYFMFVLQEAKRYKIFLFASADKYFPLVRSCILSYKQDIMKFFIPVFLIFISFYSCSRSVSDISKNMHDVLNISDEVRTYFLRKPDYWGLSTKSAITDKIISEKFVKDGKIILSGGAEVLIGDGENAEPVMPSGKTFDIVMRDLNKAKCTAYAEFDLSENDLLALVRISIINRSGKYLFEWGGENSLPVKKYFAKDFCKTRGNTIIWSIK